MSSKPVLKVQADFHLVAKSTTLGFENQEKTGNNDGDLTIQPLVVCYWTLMGILKLANYATNTIAALGFIVEWTGLAGGSESRGVSNIGLFHLEMARFYVGGYTTGTKALMSYTKPFSKSDWLNDWFIVEITMPLACDPLTVQMGTGKTQRVSM